MEALAAISSSAAGAVTANLAQLEAAIAAAGQDPGPATVSAQAASGTAAEASVAVLKKVIDLQAAAGGQLAQLIAGQVDLQA